MELNTKFDSKQYDAMLDSNAAKLVYFFQDNCSVCTGLSPKVKELIEQDFSKMELVVLDAFENRALAAQMPMMSIPGIMFYFEEKEFFRANGLIGLGELKNKMERYYLLIFG